MPKKRKNKIITFDYWQIASIKNKSQLAKVSLHLKDGTEIEMIPSLECLYHSVALNGDSKTQMWFMTNPLYLSNLNFYLSEMNDRVPNIENCDYIVAKTWTSLLEMLNNIKNSSTYKNKKI